MKEPLPFSLVFCSATRIEWNQTPSFGERREACFPFRVLFYSCFKIHKSSSALQFKKLLHFLIKNWSISKVILKLKSFSFCELYTFTALLAKREVCIRSKTTIIEMEKEDGERSCTFCSFFANDWKLVQNGIFCYSEKWSLRELSLKTFWDFSNLNKPWLCVVLIQVYCFL